MMNLHIQKTKCSPEVRFDSGNSKLCIDGASYPENSYSFFKPIREWMDSFLLQMASDFEFSIHLSIPYMNTSSSKCIFSILEKLQEFYESGKKIKICWYYNKDDETELENIEDITQDLRIPIETISLDQ